MFLFGSGFEIRVIPLNIDFHVQKWEREKLEKQKREADKLKAEKDKDNAEKVHTYIHACYYALYLSHRKLGMFLWAIVVSVNLSVMGHGKKLLLCYFLFTWTFNLLFDF